MAFATTTEAASSAIPFKQEVFEDGDQNAAADAAYAKWKVGNCKFNCSVCKVDIVGSLEFGKHVIANHDEIASSGVGDYKSKCLIDKETITCQLCQAEVLYDYTHMAVHMLENHAVDDLKDYFLRHVYNKVNDAAVDVKEEEFDDEALLENFGGESSNDEESVAVPKGQQRRVAELFGMWSKKIRKDTNRLGNGCMFRCECCGLEIAGFRDFLNHNRRCHFVEPLRTSGVEGDRTYRQMMSRYLVKYVEHECSVCRSALPQDMLLIAEHVEERHKMTWKHYCQSVQRQKQRLELGKLEYVPIGIGTVRDLAANMCWYACPDCKQGFNRWYLTSDHIRECHGREEGEGVGPAVVVSQPAYYDCTHCSETLYCQKSVVNEHLQKQHGLSLEENLLDPQPKKMMRRRREWQLGDFCKFRCERCPFVVFDFYGFKSHNMKQHGVDLSSIFKGDKAGREDAISRYMAEYVEHTCVICETAVPYDIFLIQEHVSERHGMGWQDYKMWSGRWEWAPLRSGAVTDMVRDICWYICPDCNKEFDRWDLVSSHMSERHGRKKRKVIIDPAIVSYPIYHDCTHCSKIFYCDEDLVEEHALMEHGLSLQEYLKGELPLDMPKKRKRKTAAAKRRGKRKKRKPENDVGKATSTTKRKGGKTAEEDGGSEDDESE